MGRYLDVLQNKSIFNGYDNSCSIVILLCIIGGQDMTRLQSIQLATILKDECLRVRDCSMCKCSRVCEYYLEFFIPNELQILEITQIIREVEKGDK